MLRAVLVLGCMTAACASASPAPVDYRRDETQPGAARAYARPEIRDSAPEAQAAPDWAASEGTPLSTYALRREEVQPFDPAGLPRRHRVSAGETLHDIATRYQVPLLALIDQNGLEPPYTLAAGHTLDLPPPRFHVVGRGETFEEVAQRYSVDARSLALLNRMSPPYRVQAGQRVALPAMAQARVEPDRPARPQSRNVAAAAAGRFAMPLDGEIVARYGAQPGGVHIDGIEIAGREGAAIAAAADGDVVYAGADLEAYGTLVLVRHADGYVTAYGHARRALVREGERVRAGQQVAELGARADGRPRLLFQVRRGTEAVDPAPLLGLRD